MLGSSLFKQTILFLLHQQSPLLVNPTFCLLYQKDLSYSANSYISHLIRSTHLEILQTLGRRQALAGPLVPLGPVRTGVPTQSALGRHDALLPQLLEDTVRLLLLLGQGPAGAVALVALGAAVGVAGAEDGLLGSDGGLLAWQRTVAAISRDAGARLRVIAALAAAHVAAAAAIRRDCHVSADASACGEPVGLDEMVLGGVGFFIDA